MKKGSDAPEGGDRKSIADAFHFFANKCAQAVGSPWSFVIAVVLIVAWGVSGPLFGYSDTWQLVINTSTTIITFMVVFLIQNTQNRDAHAMHLKLDELIRALKGARNRLIDLEEMSEDELKALEKEFHRVQSAREDAEDENDEGEDQPRSQESRPAQRR